MRHAETKQSSWDLQNNGFFSYLATVLFVWPHCTFYAFLIASIHNTGQMEGQGLTAGTNQMNSIVSSGGATFLGQPWHSAPLKHADFVHALQRASMSTSLFLPCRLHQGVRWIYKEAHANGPAPLPDCELWSDGGRVCLYLKVGSHERKTKPLLTQVIGSWLSYV